MMLRCKKFLAPNKSSLVMIDILDGFMRGERHAAPRLASLVTRLDQNARESPLRLQILTEMAMRPLLLNHDPADFGQPRAQVIPLNTYREI
eukprot:scaffold72003_cov88-Cyclotella_meneghiniana.AAC.2